MGFPPRLQVDWAGNRILLQRTDSERILPQGSGTRLLTRDPVNCVVVDEQQPESLMVRTCMHPYVSVCFLWALNGVGHGTGTHGLHTQSEISVVCACVACTMCSSAPSKRGPIVRAIGGQHNQRQYLSVMVVAGL